MIELSPEVTHLIEIEGGPTLAVSKQVVSVVEVGLQGPSGPAGPAGPSSLDSFTTDDLDEGGQNLYFTGERVDDRVNQLLQAGTNITLTYDDANDLLTIDAADGGVSDHGALTGLADDDHPQYAHLSQAETITGQWTVSGVALALDNDGGIVLNLPDAIGTGARTSYTFNLGGGADDDSDTLEGGTTTFKMSDIASNSLSGNDLVFDLGNTSIDLTANSSFFTLQSKRISDDVRKMQVEFAPSAGVTPGPLGFAARNEGGSGGSSNAELDFFLLNDTGNALAGKAIKFQMGDGAGVVEDRLSIQDSPGLLLAISGGGLINPATPVAGFQIADTFHGITRNATGELWGQLRPGALEASAFFGGTLPDATASLLIESANSGADEVFGILDVSGMDWRMQGDLDAASFSVGGVAGASGSFTAQSGETVTVQNGIITSIA